MDPLGIFLLGKSRVKISPLLGALKIGDARLLLNGTNI
jgi:hypothetical protein